MPPTRGPRPITRAKALIRAAQHHIRVDEIDDALEKLDAAWGILDERDASSDVSDNPQHRAHPTKSK